MRTNVAAVIMLVVLTAPVATTARAVSPDAAKTYVDAMATRALTALRSEDDRMAKFGRLIIEGVDFVTISKAALGRHGRRIGKAKLNQLAELLAALVINQTVERLREAEVTGFMVGTARSLPNRDVLVKAVVEIAGQDPLEIGWRIAQHGGALKIVDIELQGYSLRIHYQNEFERKLRYGGVDGLIRSLRDKLNGTPGMNWVQEAALHDRAVD